MPVPDEGAISAAIRDYLRDASERVVDVLAGPKRETWLSAELFVAVSRLIGPHPTDAVYPSFACYGEQEYNTVFSSVAAAMPGAHGRRRPDLVLYEPDVGVSAVGAIIEVKLVLEGEDPTGALSDLDTQLRRARQLFPSACVLGVVFLAAVPLVTPGTFDSTARNLLRATEQALSSPQYAWVSGYDFTEVFGPTVTRLFYPMLSIPLRMGVRRHV